jgi:hypothetical protein
MKNILFCLILLIAFSWSGFSILKAQPNSNTSQAQEDPGSNLDRASALLDSEDYADRAWGAYLAGQHRLIDLQPKLESLLENTPIMYPNYLNPSKSQQHDCLIRSILEAAIQMGAVLPESTLRKFFRYYHNEVAIIIAAAPEKYTEMMLSIFREKLSGDWWFAVGNMLLNTRTPEFPLILMQDMKQIPLIANVGGASGGSWSGACRFITVPSNYPPVIAYSLWDFPHPDVTITFEGPTTVYAIPHVYNPGYQYEYCTDDSLAHGLDPNLHRQRYLSSFLELPEDDITFSKRFTVYWEGPEQYKEVLTTRCNKMLTKYDQMVGLLLRRGVLTESQAESLKCTISLKIYDTRLDKSVPLPEFSLDRVVIEKPAE